jgi:outer membrane lipoprotein-sorting protein
MKQLFLLLVCSFCIGSLYAQDEAQLIKNVKAKLDKVNNYKAKGKMKINVSFANIPESDINVFYKKPNKFKVRKLNGISVLPKGGFSMNLNSLFTTDNYKAVAAGTKEIKGVLTKAVMLLPLDEKSDVVLTTLYIDEKNALIRKTSVTTRENGSYEMDMDYGKYSSYGLPDKVVFSFSTKDYKLPKGLSMEYEKGGAKKPKNANEKGSVEITYSGYDINKGVDDKEFVDEK